MGFHLGTLNKIIIMSGEVIKEKKNTRARMFFEAISEKYNYEEIKETPLYT